MKKQIFILAAMLSVLAISCENSDFKIGPEEGEELTVAEDAVFAFKSAESTESEVDAVTSKAPKMAGNMGVGGKQMYFGKNFPDCATVTISGDDFPKTIIIDYGDGCSGRNGMGRTGIVTIEMSDSITVEGAVYTVTFSGVTVGNKQIEKTSTLTNEGLNEDGNVVISFDMLMTIIHESGNGTHITTRDFSGEKEWLSGFGTPEIEDDIFLKTGGGTITVDDTITYTRTITSPVLIDRTCSYPLSGVVEISRDGEVMTIDFGDGECDNIAIVTKDGEEEEIELQSGKFGKQFKRENKNMTKKKGWW